MKLIVVSVLLMLVIFSVIEASAENERACIGYEQRCTGKRSQCCKGTHCDCYNRFVKGKADGMRCWCIEDGVTYTQLKK
uniref:U12-Saltitoxin-Pre1b_1 n=1 Tax=Phidippus regius TaxID=1905328 RepID=A0A482Z6Q4_9ARAC